MEIYCDGACRGNPGPGGWAVYIPDSSWGREIKGGTKTTTNNRMEVTAILKALEFVHFVPETKFTIFSDSQWAINAVTWKWLVEKNMDLVTPARDRLRELKTRGKEVELVWIKGHAEHPEQEMVNDLAQAEAAKQGEEHGSY